MNYVVIGFFTCLFCVLFAIFLIKLVYPLVSSAWSGLSVSFGLIMLLLLKWKVTTKQGVLAGMIIGCWLLFVRSHVKFLDNNIFHRFTAFILVFLLVIVVNKITGRKNYSVPEE